MTLDDETTRFWFTCSPGTDDPMCAYTRPANRDIKLGKHFRAGYFDIISHRGANHVLMSLRETHCVNCTDRLNFEARRAALIRYHRTRYLPTFSEWLTLLLLVILFPGVVFRLCTGKTEEVPSPERLL